MKKHNQQAGFSVIELLITLFIAVAFLVSGYQLYSVITRDGGESRTQSRASNLAYDYIQRYTSSALAICSEQSILTDQAVSADNLSNVLVTVTISCPYGDTPTISKVLVIVKYGSPQKEVAHSVYTEKVLPEGAWQQINAGDGHTCGVAGGQAYCWGSGSLGQLGNNTTGNSLIPAAVDTAGILSGKVPSRITAGVAFSCTVASSLAYCWGSGSLGQLGNGSTTQQNAPVAVNTAGVLSGKTVTDVSAGWLHTCAVASGNAYCWGTGSFGRLGNNATTQQNAPVAVNTAGVLSGKTVTAVAAGNVHSCAVADGQAYCWGWNGNGELGNNSTTQSLVPVAVYTGGVLNGKTVTRISVAASSGTRHSCAVADGQAYCWGQGAYGKLGNNSTADSSVPVAVDISGVLAGKTVTDISAGMDHTCAVAGGRVYCWGRNATWGQLGNNSTADSLVPVAVETSIMAGSATSVSAGTNHSCAIAKSRVYCWGLNSNGALGNNSVTYSRVPVEIAASS